MNTQLLEAQTPRHQHLMQRQTTTMYAPTAAEGHKVYQHFTEEINQVVEKLSLGESGIFLDGQNRNLYVIQKTSSGEISFVRRYWVTIGENGLGRGEGKTPTGFRHISAQRGGTNEHPGNSKRAGSRGWGSVTPLGREVYNKMINEKGIYQAETYPVPGKNTAGMTTVALEVSGTGHAIFFHGSDRQVYKHGNATGMGDQRSNGCIRMCDPDAVEMLNFIGTKSPVYISDKKVNNKYWSLREQKALLPDSNGERFAINNKSRSKYFARS